MPRAPRLNRSRTSPFFSLTYPGGRPTAAREDTCFDRFFISVGFRFLYFSAFCCVSVRDLCALTDQLCVATSARSKLPITAAGVAALGGFTFSVRQEVYPVLFFLLLFRSSPPVQDRMQSPCLLGFCSREEALRVTLARHMTHGASGLGRSNSDKGHHLLPWPYSFIQLANSPKERLRNMTTRCCCLFPKNEVRGGMLSIVLLTETKFIM